MPTQRASSNGARNQILSRLEPAEFERISPLLTEVPLTFKETIAEQGRGAKHVFFVESGVISCVSDLDDGGRLETGTVGNEGFCDVSTILDMPRALGTAFVQIPGRAYRMKASVVREERTRNSQLATLMTRFVGTFIAMLAQTAACNRAHPVEERMARWLLMTHDRVDRDEFPLTQEFLAQMLGVRRPTVNVAGLSLQNAGLIRYSRGRIRIANRKGLESASCECYARIQKQFSDALR